VQLQTSARRRRDVAALADLARRVPLTSPVPSCPGWDIGDLLRHVGTIHRWATEVVRTGLAHEEPPASGPDEATGLATWLSHGAAALLDQLERTHPDSECWTMGVPPARAGFWRTRQALETTLHRWDARTAVGETWELPTDAAQEGLDEALGFFLPRQVALGRTRPLRSSIELVATDADRTWTVPGAEPSVRDLWMWGRGTGALLQIEGDAAAVEEAARAALTP
jgi:uncharacterized protein (TIGR03083 family)